MKKIYHLFFAIIGMGTTATQADSFTVTISGTSYTPNLIEATVGDEITIQATGNHPLVQVTQATWDANGNTMMTGGFGPETSDYTFTITGSPETIYYVCVNHVGGFEMKGRINVSVPTGIIDATTISDLRVYPTIVSDGFFNVSTENIDLTGSILELYSTSGQLVKTFQLNTKSAVLSADIAIGTYSAVILRKNGDALLRQRMIFIAE